MENKKERNMSKLDKTLDMFCREVWHCTLYPFGIGAGSPEYYELYRGLEFNPEQFAGIISKKEIIQDREFQDWIKKKKLSKKIS